MSIPVDFNFTNFGRLAELREKGVLTDFVLISRDGKRYFWNFVLVVSFFCRLIVNFDHNKLFRFPVHRVVLAVSTEFFNKKCFRTNRESSGSKDKCMRDSEMIELDATTVESLITFLYTGKLNLTGINTSEMVATAMKWNLSKLLIKCCESNLEIMDKTNCLKLFQLAHEHEWISFKEKALLQINENLLAICETEEFGKMDNTSVLELFKQLSKVRKGAFDRLLDCFEARFSQATVEGRSRVPSLGSLVRFIRYLICNTDT